jgi:hypothetical protein
MSNQNETRMSVAEASKLLGLNEGLVSWALDRNLLVGERDRDGSWVLARDEIMAGQRPLQEQFPELEQKDTVSPEPATGKPSEAPNPITESDGDAPGIETLEPSPGPSSSPTQNEEIAALRQELRALAVTISQKDATIADLARSVSRMGEAAIERIPPTRKKTP